MREVRKGIVATILMGVFLLFGCGDSTESTYIFEKVSTGDVQKTVSATGVLEVDGVVPLLVKISGLVKRVHVEAEDKVKKGQVLAILDPTDINQKILRSGTKLESSRLKLVAAKQDFEGKKKMFRESLISRKGLEQSELDYKTALNEHRDRKSVV